MALFTPRGLKVRLPTAYAFALIARVFPRTDAFRVLQLTEEVENLGALASFIAGITAFSLRLESLQIGLMVFVAVSALRVVHLFGLFVPPVTLLLPLSRVYSRISGYGLLLAGLLAFGALSVGWQGVLGFVLGRLAAGILFSMVEFTYGRYAFRKTGLYVSPSERSFFHAYRLEASRLGASTDLSVSDVELAAVNWEAAFQDLATKWPTVVSRFTEEV